MPKPKDNAARQAPVDLPEVEPGMDEILRSIRGILGEEESPRVEFPDTSANDPGPAAPSRSEPPLAFLQRKRAPETAPSTEPKADEPAVNAGGDAGAGGEGARLSLEERLARHREKAAAERRTLRELAERAEARAKGAEPVAPEAVRPAPTAEPAEPAPAAPTAPVIDAAAIEELAEAKPDAAGPGATSILDQDLFDVPSEPTIARRRPRRIELPEIEAERVDYARPAGKVEVLEPVAAGGLDETFEEIARSMLREKSGELDGVLADMLKPLVREWLVDNLSPIVERVVREEIERVSRGAR